MVRTSQTVQKQWEQRIQKFQNADMSVSQFCKKEGVSTASFYAWRRRLKKQNNPQAFAPIEIPQQNEIQVQLPSGAVIRIPPGDRQTLEIVLQKLGPLQNGGAESC